MSALALLMLAACGRPLFYWGTRQPVVVAERTAPAPASEAALVAEVHAVREAAALLLRFSYDRPVREALRLPDGTPVSGRLRAVLYIDADDDLATGLDEGSRSLRTGADQRLELGVITVGEDAEEKRGAEAVVTAALHALGADGRRRVLWRADDASSPNAVSAHGEWVEVRLPVPPGPKAGRMRVVLVDGEAAWAGRLEATSP
jgi:hypothetical protein